MKLVDQLLTLNLNPFSKQKLLEEIEQNKDKVDECQTYAKAYIGAIKVSIKLHKLVFILKFINIVIFIKFMWHD